MTIDYSYILLLIELTENMKDEVKRVGIEIAAGEQIIIDKPKMF